MFFKNKELVAENERLRRDLEGYKTIKEELRKEMLYLELDLDGRVRRLNDLAERSTGYRQSDLDGKPLEQIVSGKSIDKQGLLAAVKSHRQWHGAVIIRNAQNRDVQVRGILQPIEDAFGSVICLALYIAEQAQDSSDSKELRDINEALHRSSAVIEFHLDGTIIKANENFLNGTGYSLDQITGKHHRMFCTEEEVSSEEYKKFWRELAQGQVKSGRFKRVDRNGNEVWLEASYNPIYDENGQLYKVVKFATVITDQMQREFAISKAANVAFSISQETGEQAKMGGEVLDSTVDTMNDLTKQMGSASEGIKDLDEQSQKVADLVKSISGIADQTNLLALNAAIEAARAGEQGRGFAVVADEVRQLASRTSSATEEIVNVVVENRKLTENAVQLIEVGQEKAREALQFSTESGRAMVEIQRGAGEIVNAIGQFTKQL